MWKVPINKKNKKKGTGQISKESESQHLVESFDAAFNTMKIANLRIHIDEINELVVKLFNYLKYNNFLKNRKDYFHKRTEILNKLVTLPREFFPQKEEFLPPELRRLNSQFRWPEMKYIVSQEEMTALKQSVEKICGDLNQMPEVNNYHPQQPFDEKKPTEMTELLDGEERIKISCAYCCTLL